MIIDTHTHAWPDKVSEKARTHLEGLFKTSFVGNPTVGTLLKHMDRNSIDTSVVCSVATKQEQVPSINEWMFGIRGERIRVFCSMHPDYPGWREELKRIKDKGDGIKFQPEFQDFYVDEERVFPLYELAQELNIPLLFHCGEELSGTMLVRSSASRILKVKQRFPGLTIIAAHFGGFRLWDEVKKFLLGTDIYLDTSFFFGFLEKGEIRQMILSHRKDRLLFGTDFPLVDQKKDIDFLKGLEFSRELEEAVFFRNAKRLLGV